MCLCVLRVIIMLGLSLKTGRKEFTIFLLLFQELCESEIEEINKKKSDGAFVASTREEFIAVKLA